MKIYCNKLPTPPSTLVNQIGKYLYKHLDGAYRSERDRNTFDVYVTLLYELKPEYGGIPNDVQEMTIIISITTYGDKIRVDTIELTPEERTLGFDRFDVDDVRNLDHAMELIKWKVGNRIRKAYKNYTILF